MKIVDKIKEIYLATQISMLNKLKEIGAPDIIIQDKIKTVDEMRTNGAKIPGEKRGKLKPIFDQPYTKHEAVDDFKIYYRFDIDDPVYTHLEIARGPSRTLIYRLVRI